MLGAVHDPAEDAMHLTPFQAAARQVPATNQPDHERLHASIMLPPVRVRFGWASSGIQGHVSAERTDPSSSPIVAENERGSSSSSRIRST